MSEEQGRMVLGAQLVGRARDGHKPTVTADGREAPPTLVTAATAHADVAPPVLLTTAEAARRLRLSARTLERLRVSGEGPRYVKAGPGKRARVFYTTLDLEAWLAQYHYSSTSEYA